MADPNADPNAAVVRTSGIGHRGYGDGDGMGLALLPGISMPGQEEDLAVVKPGSITQEVRAARANRRVVTRTAREPPCAAYQVRPMAAIDLTETDDDEPSHPLAHPDAGEDASLALARQLQAESDAAFAAEHSTTATAPPRGSRSTRAAAGRRRRR